jgi:hypothetical protein
MLWMCGAGALAREPLRTEMSYAAPWKSGLFQGRAKAATIYEALKAVR